jgi:hypothetical protein
MKALLTITLVLLLSTSYAATRCEKDSSGGICCWDTETEGPFKPISCY